jgi:hypothetical protein
MEGDGDYTDMSQTSAHSRTREPSPNRVDKSSKICYVKGYKPDRRTPPTPDHRSLGRSGRTSDIAAKNARLYKMVGEGRRLREEEARLQAENKEVRERNAQLLEEGTKQIGELKEDLKRKDWTLAWLQENVEKAQRDRETERYKMQAQLDAMVSNAKAEKEAELREMEAKFEARMKLMLEVCVNDD